MEKQKLQKSGTRIQPNINTEILKEIQGPLLHTPSLPERKWHVRNITADDWHKLTHTNTYKTCHYIPLFFSRNFSNFSLTFIVLCSDIMVIKKILLQMKKNEERKKQILNNSHFHFMHQIWHLVFTYSCPCIHTYQW